MRPSTPRRRDPRTTATLALLVVLMLLPAAAAPAQEGTSPPSPPWPADPAATASSYLLVDLATGQVLADRGADERRPVASTVKILTAISVLSRAQPDDVVIVGPEVAGIGGASTGVSPGERWTVGELLDAMLVRSGNDAAVALAVHVGGSLDDFLELMRQDAVAEGVVGATIMSVNGLEDLNRLSARDLAVLTRAAMRNPDFRRIVAQRTVTLPGRGPETTRNELLLDYPAATGVKTGYTTESGWSLVASARRAGRELLAVVLDARSADARFTDARALLEHGFGAFAARRAGLSLQLRRAGEWVRFSAPARTLLVPASDPELTTEAFLPGEIPDRAPTLALRWRDQDLAGLQVERQADGRGPVTGAAALGRWLSDRTYAALRTAVRSKALAP